LPTRFLFPQPSTLKQATPYATDFTNERFGKVGWRSIVVLECEIEKQKALERLNSKLATLHRK
jgi:hypothetical protein